MIKLLYSGPDLGTLHAEYATRGRIDPQAPVRVRREIMIAAPVATAWALLSDPLGWHRIDPAIGDVQLDGGVRPGTPFTWRDGRAKIKSRFAVVQPEQGITWTGASFGARVVHRHLLNPRGDSTQLVTEESMAGPLLPLLYGSGKLDAKLEKWLAAIKAAAESH
jgi:Polyketide cyclase / dehydrase and lipid transport